ncbi:MAG TPA: hypothetical protein VGL53_14785 [Bryobacteraceae bacterium]|jgi:hypothetical protein
MADWTKISEGFETGIPATQIEAIRGTLDVLEKTFQPLVAALTPEDDTATPFNAEIEPR